MEALMETKEMKNENSSAFFHKAFLLRELRTKGFEKAIHYKSPEDVSYIESVKDKDVMQLMEELEHKLYEAGI